MSEVLNSLFLCFPSPLLFLTIVVFIYLLVRGANLLVTEAVALSLKYGISKLLVGATVVSLGTTLPEASVSVFAAIAGRPGLALGNAVGSVICDTGLIMGLAIIIAPPLYDRKAINLPGWIQLGSGLLLVAACLPVRNLNLIFTTGSNLPQAMGFFFILLLIGYLYYSAKTAKRYKRTIDTINLQEIQETKTSGLIIFLKLIAGIGLVIISSKILIPAVQEAAIRLRIPETVIGATLVALGTSLPELATAITAVRKRHGDLAIGNIIGADILNVLFVSGFAAAVTPGGLFVAGDFFIFLFPSLLLILLIFRIGLIVSKGKLTRPLGFILLGYYIVVIILISCFRFGTI